MEVLKFKHYSQMNKSFTDWKQEMYFSGLDIREKSSLYLKLLWLEELMNQEASK